MSILGTNWRVEIPFWHNKSAAAASLIALALSGCSELKTPKKESNSATTSNNEANPPKDTPNGGEFNPVKIGSEAVISLEAGACAAVHVELQNSLGKHTYDEKAAHTVTLSSSSDTGQFNCRNACDQAEEKNKIDVVFSAKDSTSQEVTYCDSAPGTTTVTLKSSAPGALASATITVNVTTVAKLVFLNLPTKATTSDCLEIVVQAQDSANNPITIARGLELNLDSTSSTGKFYSDNKCQHLMEKRLPASKYALFVHLWAVA